MNQGEPAVVHMNYQVTLSKFHICYGTPSARACEALRRTNAQVGVNADE